MACNSCNRTPQNKARQEAKKKAEEKKIRVKNEERKQAKTTKS